MNPEDWNLQEMTQQEKEIETIGLLGPAGSGKDLVADWLCREVGFIKIPFADPIKRFASRCFGIDYDRLWGPSEKRNEVFEIDDRWWHAAIERMKNASNEITQDVLEDGVRVEGFLRMYDWVKNLRTDYEDKISARVILQTLGTEWGRAVDGTMWAKYAHKVIRILKADEGAFYSQTQGVFHDENADNPDYKGVVIPDHRFLNEIDITKAAGGYVFRLRRLEQEKKEESVGIAGHRSEAEQKTIPDEVFSHVFNFEEGVDKVYATLDEAFEKKPWVKGTDPS